MIINYHLRIDPLFHKPLNTIFKSLNKLIESKLPLVAIFGLSSLLLLNHATPILLENQPLLCAPCVDGHKGVLSGPAFLSEILIL